MKRFNISRGLNLLLVAFVVMTVALVVVFSALHRQSMARAGQVTTRTIEHLKAASGLQERLNAIHNNVQQFLRLKDPDEMEKALTGLKQKQAETEALLTTGERITPALKSKFQELVAAENGVLDQVLRGNNAEAYQAFFANAVGRHEEMQQELGRIREAVEQEAMTDLRAHEQQMARSALRQNVVVGLALLVLIAGGWRLKAYILRALQNVCTAVAESSATVAAAATDFVTTGQSLATGFSNQASALEESSAALEEITSMMQRTATNAQSAKELGDQNSAAAKSGAADMQAMTQAMDEIKTSSDNIARTLKVIDEIAFQTNLLALNAAVEAARAGEAGAGFAVVADEVRTLAQRSAQAAKDIGPKVGESIQKSGRGVELSAKVAASFHAINTKAHQMDELLTEIAVAAKEQNQGVAQINSAVREIENTTQKSAATSAQMVVSTDELQHNATILHQTVDQLNELVGHSAPSLPPQRASVRAPEHRPATPSQPRSKTTPPPRAPVPVGRDQSDGAIPMPEPTSNELVRPQFQDF